MSRCPEMVRAVTVCPAAYLFEPCDTKVVDAFFHVLNSYRPER